LKQSIADSPVPDSGSMSVRFVRALLERHGVVKYRHSVWLAEALGMSYAQAHRRMNGGAAWTLEELERVGDLFGESISEVVTLGVRPASVPAVLHIASEHLPCDVWLGDRVTDASPDALVAVKSRTGWDVRFSRDSIEDAKFAIKRLQISARTTDRRLVAVLDDDVDLTDSICGHLSAGGYDARAFYRTADLQKSMESTEYDAYVIDWIVGEDSTQEVIAAIRANDATCPILVLTAQVVSGRVRESEIAAAVTHFNLVFAEKPVRMAILTASLARALVGEQPIRA
jgi:CheY-like chemotaxis protein